MDGNPEQAATAEELQKQLEEAKAAKDLAEKRQRDTQAAYTKGQQELKAVKAEKEVLQKKVGSLTVKETEELEELKLTDPDKWYEEKKKLESQAQQELHQEMRVASQEVLIKDELARREQLLEEFNKSHPEMPLTDETIKYDVPLRIYEKLEKGEISFEDFLGEVHDYLVKPKKVGDPNTVLDQPNLGKMGGGQTPDKVTTAVDIVESYKKEIY